MKKSQILGRYLIYIGLSLEIYGLIMFLENLIQPANQQVCFHKHPLPHEKSWPKPTFFDPFNMRISLKR